MSRLTQEGNLYFKNSVSQRQTLSCRQHQLLKPFCIGLYERRATCTSLFITTKMHTFFCHLFCVMIYIRSKLFTLNTLKLTAGHSSVRKFVCLILSNFISFFYVLCSLQPLITLVMRMLSCAVITSAFQNSLYVTMMMTVEMDQMNHWNVASIIKVEKTEKFQTVQYRAFCKVCCFKVTIAKERSLLSCANRFKSMLLF